MTFRNNLKPTGSGGWTAKTTVYVAGVPKIRQVTFSLGNNKSNRASAQEWLETQEKIRAGLSSFLSASQPANLGELAELYPEAVKSDVKSITLDGYVRNLRYLLSHFDRLHHPILTQEEIDWYISQRRADGAGRSIIAELNCLRRALIRFNYDPGWTIPRWLQRLPQKESYVPSVDDYHRLSAELPLEATKALRMALFGGLRDQEVGRVGWECYTPSEGILRIDSSIRKTNSTNVIPVVDSLSSKWGPEQLTGTIIQRSPSVIKCDLRSASGRAAIKTWHGLQPARRLFVVLAEDEFDHDTISLVTGHKRMSMASRYSSGHGHIPLKRKVIEYVEGRLNV